MNEKEWFKCIPESATTLIFGEVFENRGPITTQVLFGQRAYEAFQVFVYLEQLLEVRNRPSYICWTPSFHMLYCGAVAVSAKRVVEIGSTLFATVDKLKKLDRKFLPKLRNIEYVGIEVSDFFCQVAMALHPNDRISHFRSINDVPGGNSVSRNYQSSSYAFETTENMVEAMTKSEFGLHGIWFSTSDETEIRYVLGKRLTLFSIRDTVRLLIERGYKVKWVSRDLADRLGEYKYWEAWLIYYKFSPRQDHRFWKEMQRFPKTKSYDHFEEIPIGKRIDMAFSENVNETFNFTSPEIIKRLADWRGELVKF